MITRLELSNFTAFSRIEVDFSPRINVIIGENGTGKTHLLKAVYVLCNVGNSIVTDQSPIKLKLERTFTNELIRTYKPSSSKIGSLYCRGGKGDAVITATFSQDKEVGATFSSRSVKAGLIGKNNELYKKGATFIPAKEVLSFLDGITNPNSCQTTLTNLFDATYFDLCNKLIKNTKEGVEEKTTWFREAITNSIKGEFVFDSASVLFRPGEYKEYKRLNSSKTYFAPSRMDSMSVTMIAEGFRKIGAIQQLLKTQAIGTGTTGPLLWDEPESNINPKLMQLIVQILLELSRNGQQIILATHDYVLLKWFDLLMDKGKEDHVRFHSLHRDSENREVRVASTDDYLSITPNPIDDAFGYLINREIENDMGGLGK